MVLTHEDVTRRSQTRLLESQRSDLALKKFLPDNGTVYNFDVVPWEKIPQAIFRDADFNAGNLIQYTDDLSRKENCEKHIDIFKKAEIIFVDAKKDGIMERKFLESTSFENKPVIVLDDIKTWMMLNIWREIKQPKLDFASFCLILDILQEPGY